jgi:FtsH-binding integral membrane protein
MNYNKNKKNKNISQLFKLISEKKLFLTLIFINVLLQHYITYYVSININLDTTTEKRPNSEKDANKYNTIVIGAYILAFILILLLIFVPMSMLLKFIMFSLLSALCGIIYASIEKMIDPNFIQGSAVGGTIVFVFMALYGVLLIASGIQLSNRVIFGIFYAIVLLIIVGIIQYFMYNYLIITKSVLIAIACLFVLYIVNTTNNILQRNYEGDFITASVDYYIDNSNIFRALEIDDT